MGFKKMLCVHYGPKRYASPTLYSPVVIRTDTVDTKAGGDAEGTSLGKLRPAKYHS